MSDITDLGRSESHQRAINQAAILFPYLSIEERIEWWDKLQPVSLTELTVHMESGDNVLRRLLEARGSQR